MSSQNVAVLQEAFERYQRDGFDGIVTMLHPDFTIVVPPELSAEPDTYVGPEGARRWFAGFDGFMEHVRFEIEEIIDAGGDRVIARMRLLATGAESGIEVDQPSVQVWTVRDGKLVRSESYADMESALAAAAR